MVGADDRENEWIGEGSSADLVDNRGSRTHLIATALAEHHAISKTPLARGLKVINTERASVSMRCVVSVGQIHNGSTDGHLERRSMPGAVF